jgi:hypothetical protein
VGCKVAMTQMSKNCRGTCSTHSSMGLEYKIICEVYAGVNCRHIQVKSEVFVERVMIGGNERRHRNGSCEDLESPG